MVRKNFPSVATAVMDISKYDFKATSWRLRRPVYLPGTLVSK